MKAIGDMLGNMGWVTEEDRDQVDAVLDAAERWKDGELTLTQAAAIGGSEWRGRMVPGKTRAIAMRLTPASDSRKRDLMDMVEALITLKGNVITDFGVMEGRVIRDSDAQVQQAFPYSNPVIYQPKDERA